MKVPYIFLGLMVYILGILLLSHLGLLDAGGGEDSLPVSEEQPLWPNQVKEAAEQRLVHLGVSETSRTLAIGMLFGDKSRLDTHLKAEMRQAGMSHLMAVSGLHIGVLWMIFGWLLLPLRLIPDLRLGRWVLSGRQLCESLMLLFVWGYIVLVGCPPSAMRAGVMITLVTIGNLLRSHLTSWHCLGLTALGLLMYDPTLLWQLGFQLSFMAVAGILSFGPWINDAHQPRWFRLLILTMSAQLFTLPLVAYVFHTVPVFGWLQGLLVVPLLPCYLCLLLAGILFPQLLWLAWPIDLCTIWIRQVATWTTCLEEYLLGGHLMLYPTALEAWIAFLVIVMLVVLWRLSLVYSEKSAVER